MDRTDSVSVLGNLPHRSKDVSAHSQPAHLWGYPINLIPSIYSSILIIFEYFSNILYEDCFVSWTAHINHSFENRAVLVELTAAIQLHQILNSY